MSPLPAPVVDVRWLADHLQHPEVIVADCRFSLTPEGDPPPGSEHIPGAVFLDLEKDLSDPMGDVGGRHPLPDVGRLAAILGNRGIHRDAVVVCYEQSPGQGAARLWWLLRYLGMTRVAVLDGGFPAWLAAGQHVASSPSKRAATRFEPLVQEAMLTPLTEVQAMVADGRGTLVDVRAAERYRGETEPLDPVAGSIPGAINYPWMETVTPEGFFKEPEVLARHFAEVPRGDDVVFYCGSGVTACVTLLALEHAGRPGGRLYAGGWSEWCRLPSDSRRTGAGSDGAGG